MNIKYITAAMWQFFSLVQTSDILINWQRTGGRGSLALGEESTC